MTLTLDDAAGLFAKIEAGLPGDQEKAEATTSEAKKAIRRCYINHDTRAARALIVLINFEWTVDDYDRALDGENNEKISLIFRVALAYIEADRTPQLAPWRSNDVPRQLTLSEIVGPTGLNSAIPQFAVTGAFLRRVQRGLLALLKRSFDEFARQISALLVTEPQFKTALTRAFARVGFALVPCEIQSPALEPPEMPPPTVAPKLWADRPAGMKAAAFLKEHYAPWIEAGVLTRPALKACDKPLYHAYHVWVHRHPEDAITFKEVPPSHFIVDPGEAIERRRATDRDAKARKREQVKMDKVSHQPA